MVGAISSLGLSCMGAIAILQEAIAPFLFLIWKNEISFRKEYRKGC
jgi:hypothetical protein